MRFRIPQPHAVRHPLTGQYVVPQPGVGYPDDDPLVVGFPWMFCSAEELDELSQPAAAVASVRIEDATRKPGTRRKGTKRA